MEYSRYNARIKYELIWYSTYSSVLLFYNNGSHKGFVWVLCDWSFQVLGYLTMDEGIRISKRLSLGMPDAPQDNIQRSSKQLSLGMPRVASPISSNDHRYFTWNYIFIHHILSVLLGASCIIWVFACFALCFKCWILVEHTFL